MVKKLLFMLLFFLSIVTYAQNSYSQTEVDLKLELQKKEMDEKLTELKNEKDKVDIKMIEQDKRLAETQSRLSKIIDIFGLVIAALTILITIAGFFMDKSNKKKRQEIEDEFDKLKAESEKQIDYIRQHAQLVAEKAQLMVEKAALEIDHIKEEAHTSLAEINIVKNTNNESHGSD
ncbi:MULTISPECIES: hypothetical protein [unclassified Dysgonomonas]|uniref:hypothetical protein n=1 Tax=unclassified Dysgonomonas TaxID=2630389 RepID=UPI000AD32005|nr:MULTISPECIES: hypothetical protein [unclassified Dysgonomonas]MBD8347327.1 hypothetical protein [Dysgonomonas sp. HGC4]MBF0576850.1 hypothetical protein [Dysgonomonas sp. GY617]